MMHSAFVRGFRVAVAVLAVSAAVSPAFAEKGIHVPGKAVDSQLTILKKTDNHSDKVTLILNNTGDKVGAEFSNCPASMSSDDILAACDEGVKFSFPQLTVDAQNKTIKLGNEVVAREHYFKGWVMSEGWHFVVIKTPGTLSDGFNSHSITRVAVALVH